MNRRVALVKRQKLLSRDAGSPDLISAYTAASSLAAIAAKNFIFSRHNMGSLFD
jgi:hypothetical protein